MQQKAKPLSLREKTGAFVRGIAGRGPLLEIARKGLASNIPDSEAEHYAIKLASSSNPQELSGMLSNGQIRPENAQEIIAKSILTKCTLSGGSESFAPLLEDALSSGGVTSKEAQEILASALMIIVTSRLENPSGVSWEAFNIWKSGKVTCAKAKEHLAWCVKNHGSALQAVEIFKLGNVGVAAQMHLSMKISSCGEPVHAYEALMSANATFDEAQKMFASIILRSGTPAMARTALMGDVVTDPEAVIFLKQALKA